MKIINNNFLFLKKFKYLKYISGIDNLIDDFDIDDNIYLVVEKKLFMSCC